MVNYTRICPSAVFQLTLSSIHGYPHHHKRGFHPILYFVCSWMHCPTMQQISCWVHWWQIQYMAEHFSGRASGIQGFMVLMGIVCLPAIRDYWKKSDAYYYAPVTGRITRNWCFELRQYLHFVDNSTLLPPGSPSYDRLGKLIQF